MAEQVLSLHVDRTLAEVVRVSEDFAMLWERRQLPDAPKFDVLLALEEILSNIIRHSQKGPADVIVVRAILDGEEIEIQLEDDGPAFDPLEHPPPRLDLPLQQRQTGGLGIHLVRRLMDRVNYERSHGRNCFMMAKKLSNGL